LAQTKTADTAKVNNLKEVTIKADKPIIKQEVDRITYDLQADPQSKV
jgi:ferric enterobactin receptor